VAVCIEDFEAVYDGQLESFTAGLTHVHDHHEIARRYPEKFAPDGTAIHGVPARVHPRAADVRRTSRSAWPEATDWPPTPESKPAGKRERFRPDPTDPEVQKSARHEAGHVAAAAHFGWRVTDVELHARGGGHAGILPPRGRNRKVERRQFAVILYCGRLHAGWSSDDGSNSDRWEAHQTISGLVTSDFEHRWLKEVLQRQASELAATGRFKFIADRVAERLLETGWIGRDQCAELLRSASHQYAVARS
jgi:hypothetical protein